MSINSGSLFVFIVDIYGRSRITVIMFMLSVAQMFKAYCIFDERMQLCNRHAPYYEYLRNAVSIDRTCKAHPHISIMHRSERQNLTMSDNFCHNIGLEGVRILEGRCIRELFK